MDFPKTLEELKRRGYLFQSDSRCRSCGAEIEWWLTPRQKWIPMNPMACGEDEAVPHWTVCENAKRTLQNEEEFADRAGRNEI